MLMKPYIISTDCMADLPADFVREHHLSLHPLYYLMGDTTYNALEDALPEKNSITGCGMAKCRPLWPVILNL